MCKLFYIGISLIIQTFKPHPVLHGYKIFQDIQKSSITIIILQSMSCHNNKEDKFDILIILCGIMILFITVTIYICVIS